MAAETVLDRLVTELRFRGNLRELKQVEGAVDRTKRRLDGLARGAGRIGAVATAAGAAAVKAFAGPEAKFAEIVGLVGVAREQIEAWKPEIADIGRETGKGPQELADSLFFITSAGLRGANAMDVLRQSAKASAAGLGDQAVIADLLTSAMNAYGAETLNAQAATDGLTEAVRLGKLEPASLAGALSRVLPVTSAMGVSFNEAAAALAAMSKTGTTAEEGATQLRAILNSFLKPTQQAEKAMLKFGLTPAAIRSNIEKSGLWNTLMGIRKAFGITDVSAREATDALANMEDGAGLDDLKRSLQGNNAVLAEIFPNIRALTGIFDLMGPGIADNAVLFDEMGESLGVLEDAFGAGAKTIQRQWNISMAQAKFLLMGVGEQLKPVVVRLLAGAQAVMAWVEQNPMVTRLLAGFLAMGPALLGVAAGAKAASLGLGFVADGYRILRRAGADTLAWLQLRAAATGRAVMATAVAIRTAFGNAFAWVSLYGQAAWKAISGASLANMRAAVLGVFARIQAAGVASAAAVRAQWLAMLGVPGRVAGQVRAAGGVFPWFRGIAGGALRSVGLAFLTFGRVATLSIVSIPVVGWVLGIITVLGLLVAWFRKPIWAFFRGLWEKLGTAMGRLRPSLLALQSAFSGLLDALGPVGAAVRKLFGGFGAEAGDAAKWGALFGEVLIGWVQRSIRNLAWLIEKFTDLVGWIKKGAKAFRESWVGRKLFGPVEEGLQQQGAELPKTFERSMSDMEQLLPSSDAQRGPLSRLTAAGRAIIDTMAQGVLGAGNRLDQAVARVFGGVGLPGLTHALATPLPVAPAPAYEVSLPGGQQAGPAGSSSRSVEVHLAEGAVQITVPGGDPVEIEQVLTERMGQVFRTAAEQADGLED